MDNCSRDLVYFVNSQGKRTVLSSPENRNYWELVGRSGFTAPNVDIFSEKFASGEVKYFGKALKPRTCTMQMVCRGKSTAERDRIFFEMLDVLMDVDGTGEGKLYVKRSNGQTVYLNCVYSGGMNITEKYKKLHLFKVEFYAADPRFYFEKKYEFRSTSGLLTIFNGTQENIWPKFYYKNLPEASVSTDNVIISNQTTGNQIEILSWIIDSGILAHYKNVSLITEPSSRSAWGDKSRGSYDQGYMLIPEIFPDGDISCLDFPLVPGDNVIEYSDMYGYGSGYISHLEYYMGA